MRDKFLGAGFGRLAAVLILLGAIVFGLSGSPAAAAEKAFAKYEQNDTIEATDFRQEVAQSIIEAARASDELRPLQKWRITRIMRGRGLFAEQTRDRVINRVVGELVDDGTVYAVEDGVRAEINWADIASIIQELLPIILQIISMFGG